MAIRADKLSSAPLFGFLPRVSGVSSSCPARKLKTGVENRGQSALYRSTETGVRVHFLEARAVKVDSDPLFLVGEKLYGGDQ